MRTTRKKQKPIVLPLSMQACFISMTLICIAPLLPAVTAIKMAAPAKNVTLSPRDIIKIFKDSFASIMTAP